MPWESKTVEEIRKEFIEAAKTETNISQLCREYGISRPTGYKWLKRSKNGESLSDRRKTPNNIANKTPAEIEEMILELRRENPGWGGKTIRQVLENRGETDLPCAKTIGNILSRNNCISKEESLKHKAFIRFEKEECNEMWQTDFKGEFKTADNKYCYPLTIIDDKSRFSIRIQPELKTANIVIPAFKEAFYEYGMPKSILSDNGVHFSKMKRGYTQFEKWLMNHDILPIHGRIKHPQTQGKIERFHRTMKYELLVHNKFADINEANKKIQEWRIKYNEIRPHEAIGMRCPADIYQRSSREYVDKVDKYEYDGRYRVIKINSWGYARFNNWDKYFSETMIDEYIEFRPNPLGDSFYACYRNFIIAEFSAVDGEFINRTIRRL